MNKFLSLAMLTGASMAVPGPNGYSRGVPPTTANCRSYILSTVAVTGPAENGLPGNLMAAGSGVFESQDKNWGIEVDREFGGCRCADEDEMEFQPSYKTPADNTWACRCLNTDLYLSAPVPKYECSNTAGSVFAPAVSAQEYKNGCNVTTHPIVRLAP